LNLTTVPFHKSFGPFKLGEIADIIQADISVDAREKSIFGISALNEAKAGELSFLDNPKYIHQAEQTLASAVIIHEKQQDYLPKNVIPLVVKNPYFCYAKALQLFYPLAQNENIHPTATIEKSANIGKNVHIGAHCYIGENVTIADGCIISSGVTIQYSSIGKNCIIHPNAAIGQDGFGFARNGTEIIKIPQIGAVNIGNNVEIGANTTVDRGALTDTVIGDHCKIDNQVQIAHNVKMGQGCQISGQTGIAGSATLGNHVITGGQVGINGHIKIADGVMLAARTLVTKDITEQGCVMSGFPATPIKQWRKNQARLNRLLKQK
jgi:UDP-3-O-[3-hydroxymyristoyl] glucosamine N-acyltransferase